MMIINITVLIIFIILFILSRETDKELVSSLDKKQHKLITLYPISLYIIQKLRIERKMYENQKIRNNLLLLNNRQDINKSIKLYFTEKISLVILIIIASSILSIFASLSNLEENQRISNYLINRPTPNQYKEEIDIVAQVPNNGKLVEKKYKVSINEQKHKLSEIEVEFEKAFLYIKNTMLGENEKYDEIKYNLKLIKGVPNSNIQVDWQSDNYAINSFGIIDFKRLPPEGTLVNLTVRLSYYDVTSEYVIPIKIIHRTLTEEEELEQELLSQLENSNNENPYDSVIKLPDNIKGKHIKWKLDHDNLPLKLIIFGVIIAILIYFIMDQDLIKKVSKRNNQLLIQYPEIVSKFTLLIGAGMTINKAWGKIALDYKKTAEANKKSESIAYNEVLTAWYEVQAGVPEVKAYDNFGKRCSLQPYLRLSSLIIQNLRKGSSDLITALERETVEAFEQRKEIAKVLGEEASTKLLIPMMLMLAIVIVIIMLPALMSMSI